MAKNLIIVESPAKARTISRFVGKDYKVAASMGHVRDLPARELGFDVESFDPKYVVSQDKRSVIQALKKDIKQRHDCISGDRRRPRRGIYFVASNFCSQAQESAH